MSVLVCVSVCLSVCLSVCSLWNFTSIFIRFLCASSAAVAQSSSGVVAICYVLPVLRITSYLHILDRIEACQYTMAASDVTASSCAD